MAQGGSTWFKVVQHRSRWQVTTDNGQLTTSDEQCTTDRWGEGRSTPLSSRGASPFYGIEAGGWDIGNVKVRRRAGFAFLSIYHYNTEIAQSQCVLAEDLKIKYEG